MIAKLTASMARVKYDKSCIARFAGSQQPTSSSRKSNTDRMAFKPGKGDMLDQSMSLQEIKKRKIEELEESKINEIIDIEESVDLPYYLHGVQNLPEKKVVYCEADKLHRAKNVLSTQSA